jgi:polyhydroxyalkanoate synthesis regulator phasin
MGKLDNLIDELVNEEGLSREEAEALRDALAERKRKRAGALAKRESDEIDFPTSPQGGSQRGIEMYGNETKAQAYERWMEQELDDAEGAYGPGGMSAGGIFGDGVVSMPDYDPTAQRRTEARAGGVAQLRTVQVLEKILDRLDAVERTQRLGPHQPDPRQLRGKGRRG